MAIQISSLQRNFQYGKITLQDIPGLSLKEVVKSYSGIYPELVNSTPNLLKVENGIEYYDFSAKAGLKG